MQWELRFPEAGHAVETAGIMESVYRYCCSQHVMYGLLQATHGPGNAALAPSRGKRRWSEGQRSWELPVLRPSVWEAKGEGVLQLQGRVVPSHPIPSHPCQDKSLLP